MDIETFAQQLRIERLRRGWTLKQVSDLTRINVTILKLLEEKSFKKIGDDRTIETLLRTYSKVLGDVGPSPGSFSSAPPKSSGRKRYLLRYGSYLPPILAAGLIIAVIAGLGLLYNEFGNRSIASNIQIPEVRLEYRSDQSKTEESNVAPGDRKKNAASQDGEILFAGPAGIENHEDETKVNRDNIELSGEKEGNTSLPVKESLASNLAQKEVQEAPAKEDTLHDGKPSSASTSDDKVFAPADRSGSEDALSSATANTRSIGVPHQLELRAAEKAWIQVTIDGTRPESELLQPGERKKWKAFKRADLVIGNRGGVQIIWDGRLVGLDSKKSRVIRLSLSDSGAYSSDVEKKKDGLKTTSHGNVILH